MYLFGHPRRTWVFSKSQGFQYHFPENFRCNLAHYEKQFFFDSSLHHIFESENFRFPFSYKKSLTCGVKCENQTSENRREFIKLAWKFVREWDGHVESLEMFSLPQVLENSRQYLLRTDILQTTVVGCPCVLTHLKSLRTLYLLI